MNKLPEDNGQVVACTVIVLSLNRKRGTPSKLRTSVAEGSVPNERVSDANGSACLLAPIMSNV